MPPCSRALAVVVCVKGAPKRLSRVFRTDGAFFASCCRRRRRARQGWQSFCCGCIRWQSCRLLSGFPSSCFSCLRRCSRSSRRNIAALWGNSAGRWPDICKKKTLGEMGSACGLRDRLLGIGKVAKRLQSAAKEDGINF